MTILDTLRSYAGKNGLKRAIIPFTALLLTLLFLLLTLISSPWWLVGLLPSAALVALGAYDMTQRNWTITRNYPVAARFRWLALNLRPYLRAYVVESDQDGKPFSYEARQLVYARARGTPDMQPFGTEYDVQSEEYTWLTHSMAPQPEPQTNVRVPVGGDRCEQPYAAALLNISAMSFGALSAAAVEAMNKGAAIGGFYQDTGEGGVSPYHLKHGGDLVWELGTGYFGARDPDGRFDPELFRTQASDERVRMTEIKLSQGAKPGHGGVLPGKKVTNEIARSRGVPAGEDCISPRAHSAFSTPIELLEFAERMRSLSGGKPVGIKLCVGHLHEVMALMKAMLETGKLLDYIVVDGAEGGTGAAPLELSNHVGMPLREGLVVLRNALVGSGLRDKIRLAASGKIYSAAGLAECLAIGADWCNAARPFMFSVGCIQAQRCHTDTCPTGVATQDPGRQRGLIVDVQAERAASFQAKTLHALEEIVAAAGLDHPSGLQPHHLFNRINANESRPVDRVWQFLEEGALLENPEKTPYAHWWRAARADTFQTDIKLEEERSASIRRGVD